MTPTTAVPDGPAPTTPSRPSSAVRTSRGRSGGFAAEGLSLAAPIDGDYDVGVHYRAAHGAGDATATVKVFCGGTQIGDDYAHALHESDLWTVASIRWTGNSCSIVQVDTIEPNMVSP